MQMDDVLGSGDFAQPTLRMWNKAFGQRRRGN
jgi:hypothetical protein